MKKDNKTDNQEIDLTRRKAFSRLGLAATAIYAAPALMTLSQANAATSPSNSAPGNSAPSNSAPSNSAPSNSAPSNSAPSTTPSE